MKVEMATIVHDNYEKICDELLWFNKNWVLKFYVILNKTTDRFGKVNYHKEVGYYKDRDYCVNINRSFDYYLSIESAVKDDFGNKEFIMIRMLDLYVFKYKLQQVSEWFTSDKFQGLFAKSKEDGKIFMPSSVNPIKITGLALDKYLEFEPSILNCDNGTQLIGVRIYVNSDTNSFFVDINRFLGIKYFIDTFNMYQSAQLMLNYLQRPEYGTNIYNIDNKPQVHKFL